MPRPSARVLRGCMIVRWRRRRGFARLGAVVAHQALDERALAGAVLAEQRVQRPGAEVDRGVKRAHVPESLAKADDLDVGRRPALRVRHREIDSSLGAPASVRLRDEL